MNSDPKTDRIIGDLLHGIMHWAAQEDGVPDFMADAFNAGMLHLNWEYTDVALTAMGKREDARPACEKRIPSVLDVIRLERGGAYLVLIEDRLPPARLEQFRHGLEQCFPENRFAVVDGVKCGAKRLTFWQRLRFRWFCRPYDL